METYSKAYRPVSPDVMRILAIINRADPLLLKQILDRCRLLYGPIQTFQRLRLYAFKRYQDHRRFLDLERRFVNQTLDRLAAGQ
ncbi:MAG: hypothetical protein NW701_03320 [Nitrospira sp.]